MNKWKAAFFTTLVLLLSLLVFSTYAIIDSGVSYTYLQDSYDHQLRTNQLLGEIIVKGGQDYSQKDFLHLLRQTFPNELIVEEGNEIHIDGNTFSFENGKLVKAK